MPSHKGVTLADYIDNLFGNVQHKIGDLVNLNDTITFKLWTYFKGQYSRTYGSAEEEKARINIFKDNAQFVAISNAQNTFELALNQFADWTLEEFDLFKKGLTVPPGIKRFEYQTREYFHKALRELREHQRSTSRRERLKRKRFFIDWFSGGGSDKNNGGGDKNNGGNKNKLASFDWRDKNVVGSVKNQLKCGSCYAFASAAVLESLYAIKTGSSVIDLSPQELVDCSGNSGCSGGLFEPTMDYVISRGGKLATLASYPYVGSKQSCSSGTTVNLGQIKYGAVPVGNETFLAEALVTYGPMFIGLDAESRAWMFYKSGILTEPSCPNRRRDMDHALLLVGFGVDSTTNKAYWIIKNSYGTAWGENGYFRLAKDANNMCGIATMAAYAKLS
ncbi:unnamed protein product [Didymodactylos carnosus]|uniref:Uncharacterized protein n=1 Tax=Didymodactylos carnosus TaxID=1234261 RepID=A0A814UYC1_9BILA|nr:unnamed protein product [Didymodactylos carnosus]CAF3944772.1 unnamed protein product [Didymodactylos carnosus]